MMTARTRRSFTPEFKAQTVELVRTSGKSVTEVCRDLDLTETAVNGPIGCRRWWPVARHHWWPDESQRLVNDVASRKSALGVWN
jgi:transposase-like protein